MAVVVQGSCRKVADLADPGLVGNRSLAAIVVWRRDAGAGLDAENYARDEIGICGCQKMVVAMTGAAADAEHEVAMNAE